MFDEYDEQGEHLEAQHGKCKDKDELLRTFDACFELARAYVPFQRAHSLFSPEDGLVKGTIFPELFHPYTPKHSMRQGG